MNQNVRKVFLFSHHTYRLKENLRFELALDSEINFHKRIQGAIKRAQTLFDEVFLGEEDIELIIPDFAERSGNGLIRKYLKLPNYQLIDSFTTPVFEPFGMDEVTMLVIRTKLNNVRIKKIIEGLCYKDFVEDGKLRIKGYLFFYNLKTETLVNIYDDRGCDIWSTNITSQRKLYNEYNDWILDYDRKEIDSFYSNNQY
jgi:hypothetical protein